MNEPNALTIKEARPVAFDGAHTFRSSTDAAGLCREIVIKTAKNIQGRKYVCVEGWQSIAIAHGCTASARDVEAIEGGVRSIGEVRRMSDGQLIAQAEGFVGDDETMWAKRPMYARRAMAQTRAISRACRSAFAHVVVMIDAGLSTTPAEEVPDGGFDDAPRAKVATVTGKVEKRKPQWTKEETDEAGSLRASIIEYPNGDAQVRKLWKHMEYDAPSDVIDALGRLLQELQNDAAELAAQDKERATP